MVTCDSCLINLGAEHLLLGGTSFCCEGCAAGGPCVCTYEHDLRRFPPAHYALPVSLGELLDRYEDRIRERAPRRTADVVNSDQEESR